MIIWLYFQCPFVNLEDLRHSFSFHYPNQEKLGTGFGHFFNLLKCTYKERRSSWGSYPPSKSSWTFYIRPLPTKRGNRCVCHKLSKNVFENLWQLYGLKKTKYETNSSIFLYDPERLSAFIYWGYFTTRAPQVTHNWHHALQHKQYLLISAHR